MPSDPLRALIDYLESGNLWEAKKCLESDKSEISRSLRSQSLVAFANFWNWTPSKIGINASKLAVELYLRGMSTAQLRKLLEFARAIKEQPKEKKKVAILKMYSFIAYQSGRKETRTRRSFEVLLRHFCPLLMDMLKKSESEFPRDPSSHLYSFLEAVVAYFNFFSEGRRCRW